MTRDERDKIIRMTKTFCERWERRLNALCEQSEVEEDKADLARAIDARMAKSRPAHIDVAAWNLAHTLFKVWTDRQQEKERICVKCAHCIVVEPRKVYGTAGISTTGLLSPQATRPCHPKCDRHYNLVSGEYISCPRARGGAIAPGDLAWYDDSWDDCGPEGKHWMPKPERRKGIRRFQER